MYVTHDLMIIITISILKLSLTFSQTATTINGIWHDNYTLQSSGFGGWYDSTNQLFIGDGNQFSAYHGPYHTELHMESNISAHIYQYFQCAYRSTMHVNFYMAGCDVESTDIFSFDINGTNKMSANGGYLSTNFSDINLQSICKHWKYTKYGPYSLDPIKENTIFQVKWNMYQHTLHAYFGITNITIECDRYATNNPTQITQSASDYSNKNRTNIASIIPTYFPSKFHTFFPSTAPSTSELPSIQNNSFPAENTKQKPKHQKWNETYIIIGVSAVCLLFCMFVSLCVMKRTQKQMHKVHNDSVSQTTPTVDSEMTVVSVVSYDNDENMCNINDKNEIVTDKEGNNINININCNVESKENNMDIDVLNEINNIKIYENNMDLDVVNEINNIDARRITDYAPVIPGHIAVNDELSDVNIINTPTTPPVAHASPIQNNNSDISVENVQNQSTQIMDDEDNKNNSYEIPNPKKPRKKKRSKKKRSQKKRKKKRSVSVDENIESDIAAVGNVTVGKRKRKKRSKKKRYVKPRKSKIKPLNYKKKKKKKTAKVKKKNVENDAEIMDPFESSSDKDHEYPKYSEHVHENNLDIHVMNAIRNEIKFEMADVRKLHNMDEEYDSFVDGPPTPKKKSVHEVGRNLIFMFSDDENDEQPMDATDNCIESEDEYFKQREKRRAAAKTNKVSKMGEVN